jgi:hypothetical protein
MLADEYILSFISLSAHIQPTEFYQLLLLPSSSVFSISSGSGLDIKKYQHSSKLWTLAAIICDIHSFASHQKHYATLSFIKLLLHGLLFLVNRIKNKQVPRQYLTG